MVRCYQNENSFLHLSNIKCLHYYGASQECCSWLYSWWFIAWGYSQFYPYHYFIWLPQCQGRDQSRFASSQWETSLQCNEVSHWLGAYLDWSLQGSNTREWVDKSHWHVEGILPKGPYLPCVSMAGRALLAGYHRCTFLRTWRCGHNVRTTKSLSICYGKYCSYISKYT